MRLLVLSILLVPCLVWSLPSGQKPVRFDGHKLLEILHNTESDLVKLLEMEVKFQLDFWKLPKHVNDTAYVRVPPTYLGDFLAELEGINAHVTTVIDDVQTILDQSPQKTQVSHRRSTYDLYKYHTYASIQSYLRSVTSSRSSGLTASVFNIGNSYESRPIEGIKITSSSGSSKRSIVIDGGIHAREWIAPAAVIYAIDQLSHSDPSSPFYTDVNWLLSHYDVYLLPCINPDGYEYTDVNRLWRKNRHPSGHGNYGVDLNRNFPFHWDPSIGGSRDPNSDLYSGPSAGSEPETQRMVQFLKSVGNEADAYLTLHSYGQMWLYPWGYTADLPSDWHDLDAAARAGTSAILTTGHSRFTVGSSTRTLYSAAGGSDDFAKGVAGIKYSYTLELRDTGRYGFQLPTSQIQPASEEFFAGFLAFARNMYATENRAGK